MKKLVLTFLIFIFPLILNAAWWNPFSWGIFNRDKVMLERIMQNKSNNEGHYGLSPVVATTTSRFYVKYDNSRVRECPSTDCKVLGYFKRNDWFEFEGNVDLNDLANWIEIHPKSGQKDGYLNKTVLSETPVEVVSNSITNNNTNKAQLLEANKQVIVSWLTDIKKEEEEVRLMIVRLNASNIPTSVSSVVREVLENYEGDLIFLQLKLSNLLNNFDGGLAKMLIDQYQEKKKEFPTNLNVAVKISEEKSDSYYSAKLEAEKEAINDYYRKRQIQQDTINQAQIDAANSRAAVYKEILDTAKREGVTQSVVNGQLNAAGFGKQINCYTSSIGGMTPNGGSITCY